MKRTCKTSVIIPVYNTEKYLPACLDSVLAQTQHDIEVILVDDGSTDGSLEIERAYAKRDSRVRMIQQPNLKQGSARNRGLAMAQGEYIYFMDSDDIIVPEHFDTCYRICEENRLDFVTFDSVGFANDPSVEQPELFKGFHDRRGKTTEDIVDGPTFWTANFHDGSTPFVCWLEYFNHSFLIENSLYFVEGIYFEDNDWIVRVFMAAKRIKYVPLRLHRYRHRPGSNVQAGFTHVLADSCFDVHAVLCQLARCEQDPIRLQMIKNVSDSKDHRFRQFAELDPTDHLRQRAACFVKSVLEECSRDDLPETIRSMHFAATTSLAEGVSAWPDSPVVFSKELARTLMRLESFGCEKSARLGIYGTGKACDAFLKIFDMDSQPHCFLETEVSPNRMYRGERVLSIRDARSLALDAIIITSAKYAEAMKANVVSYLGEDIPIYVAPRRIYALADGALAFQLDHPQPYKARK